MTEKLENQIENSEELRKQEVTPRVEGIGATGSGMGSPPGTWSPGTSACWELQPWKQDGAGTRKATQHIII